MSLTGTSSHPSVSALALFSIRSSKRAELTSNSSTLALHKIDSVVYQNIKSFPVMSQNSKQSQRNNASQTGPLQQDTGQFHARVSLAKFSENPPKS